MTRAYLDPSRSPAERAHDLVGRMTLDEKAAQLEDWATAIPRLGVPDYQTWNESLHGVARAGYATAVHSGPESLRHGFNVDPIPLDALRGTRTLAPDLLITDVVMPEMSGIDLAIKVKELRPGCRILLFSGQATTADLLAGAKAEGHDFELLQKPVYPKDLVSRIRGLATELRTLSLANTISADSTLGAA